MERWEMHKVRCRRCGKFKTPNGWETKVLNRAWAYIWDWDVCPDCIFDHYHIKTW